MIYNSIEYEFVVKVLEEYDADDTELSTRVVDTGIDSFGVAMLFLELDTKYGCFPASEDQSSKVESYTVKDLVDIINNRKK